jgi:aspartyl-tRNA(Asn)/glutamyl-tRNA(Gln) amidotransferase subunit A
LIKKDFAAVFAQADVLIAPTTPAPAFKIGEKAKDATAQYLHDFYTVPANLAGVCAISLPCGISSGNLPIGMQLIGKPLGELDILRAAYAFEQNHAYHSKIAPLEGGAL